MKGKSPIYKSNELKVYRYLDDYVRYYNSTSYCCESGYIGDAHCEMILASSLLDAGTEETYIAEITGNSMCDADIHKGDKVIINTQRTPVDGDVVLANVDGDILLKFLQHDRDGNAWLVPANSMYKPMMVDFKLYTNSIIGVMTSIIREKPKFDAVLKGRLDKAYEEYRSVKVSDDEDRSIFKLIPQGKDKKAILERLHHVLDDTEGVYVIKVLVAAKSVSYLSRLPSYGVLTDEFDVRISHSQYYRDKDNRYDEGEIRDIIDSLT